MFLPVKLAEGITGSSVPRVSPPGLFVFFLTLAAGVVGAVLLNQPAPVFAGLLIGLYLMFAIQVAKQWEKAAVLRLGRYRGLRGPGPFLIVPIIDSVKPLRRSARARDRCSRGIRAHPRYRAGQRGRDHFLAGVGRGEVHPRSAGFPAGHYAERADGAPRVYRPA